MRERSVLGLTCEQRRRPLRSADAPARHLERTPDDLALCIFQRRHFARRTGEVAELRLLEQTVHLENRAAGQDASTLENVSELADVARPGVTEQAVHEAWRDPGNRLVELAFQANEEMLHQVYWESAAIDDHGPGAACA